MRMLWHHEDDAAAEQVVSFRARGGAPLTLASNDAYEVWIDGRFVGDGGHRCVRGQAFITAWPEAATAREVVVRVHHLHAAHNEVLLRALFDDPFLAVSSGDWECRVEREVAFAGKLSAQLPRQCVLWAGAEATFRSALEVVRPGWTLVAGPVRARHIAVDPLAIAVVERKAVAEIREWPDLHAIADASALVRENAADLCVEAFDLGAFALHRFEVATTDPCVLLYGEVADLDALWSTRWRAKVRLADAFAADVRASPIGHRGCRYLHVARARGAARPVIRVQRREYPFRWRASADPPRGTVEAALRANLVACVDGGLVDTCWRERAQWTGDARMSAMALRALTHDTAPITLALQQIAASYDEERAMVMGVWPIHNTAHDFVIPGFHLAFCLAALEQDPALSDPLVARVVRHSVERWRGQYVHDGVLVGLRGWNFVDWDPRDARLEGDGVDPDAPHAVAHAWWADVCALMGIDDGLDRVHFARHFARGGAWALFASDAEPNLHASAAVAASVLGVSERGATLAWLRAREDSGELRERMTPYFAYFVAAALHAHDPAEARAFIERFYGPIAREHGAIHERTHDGSSRAHGWSVGIARFL